MATYEEIYGKRVKDFDSDPTLDSNYEGQVWYNSGSGTLKSVVAFDSFTSSASMNTGRYFMAGAGSQTAALSFGGDASPPFTNASEEYNGSGWTNTSSMNTARTGLAGAGTSTAGLGFGGYFSPPASNKNETEEYNGSSWSEQNNLGTARYRLAGAGTQTAALAFGGNAGPTSSTVSADTEEYNGTSWSEQNNLSQGRRQLGGLGIQTAALAFGGRKQPGNVDVTDTEEYDGTSWSSGGALPQISRGYSGTAGTQTAGLSIGGVIAPGIYNGALKYDGSTWSISPATMATGTNEGSGLMSGSTQSAGMTCGGYGPSSVLANTEEFNSSINTFTAGAWASGGNMNTGRGRMGGFGTQTAAVASGGYIGPPGPNTNQGENYNGTSWTVSGSPSQTNNSQSATGTQTAGILISGGNPYTTIVQTYNGSSYSTAPFSTNTQRGNGGACGTQTAGLFFAGYSSTTPPHTGPGTNGWSEEYDGEGFTNTNLMVTGRTYVVAAGNQTAALSAGGGNGPTPSGSVCEEYDGTNWSTVNNMLTTTGSGAGGGTQTAAWYAGGSTGGPGTTTTNSSTYDGTNWSTGPNLGTARYILSAANSAPNTTGLVFGGFVPSPFTGMNNTEEFTGETETVTASTLTTS